MIAAPTRTLVPFAEAQRLVLAACATLADETVALGDAGDRVVARPIVSTETLVPYARSAMDGYAVRAADASVGARLPIAAAFAAAGTAPPRLAPGTAMQIATGAPLPLDADAVVPIEDVVVEGEATIFVVEPATAMEHVFPAGEDAVPGMVLADRGCRLRAADLGVLAAAGVARLAVVRRPRVTLFSTGDELVPVDVVPGFGQIRNSNAVTLAQALTSFGCALVAVRHLADDETTVRDALEAAFATSDLVVTTGGASVGRRDYVKRVARELGTHFVFDTIAMRPSKPTAFGIRGTSRLAVLPGNPAAAFVALHELVRLACRALGGEAATGLPRVRARLAEGSVRGKNGRTFYAFAEVFLDEGAFAVRLLDNQCSSLTTTAAAANAFIVVPDAVARFGPGDLVDVDVIDFSDVREKA